MCVKRVKKTFSLLLLPLCLACHQPGDRSAAMEGPDMAPPLHPDIWPRPEQPLDPDPALEGRITEMLAAMSVEAKVGQLIQAEINSITPAEVTEYRIGSVLNGGGGWPAQNKQSTPADWLALADAFWEAALAVPAGEPAIPIFWGLDAVHGHNNVIGATLFPHNIALGATHNPELIRAIGRATAVEVAVTGQDWNFGPTVAVARDDRWGRAYESYSEDPGLVAAYAPAMVEGLQGQVGSEEFLAADRVIATAKHFLGDGGTEHGVDQGDTLASEEELRDIHGAGYVPAIEAGVQTIMASFNSWQGTKIHGYKELLTEVLKERMGFDGLVVGDWNAHGQVPGCSNESCPQAINAGLDMFMVPRDWKALYANTLEQVESGEIAAARLDDAVRRILRVKLRAGLFERGKPSSRPLGGRFELLGSPEHRAVARQAVRESLVLLKNDGNILPLHPKSRILVAGDGADDIGKQSGGWTITWQGTGTTKSDFPGATSIWDAIREVVQAAGGTATLSPDGHATDRPDAAIVVFGEDPYAEFQGDRSSIAYSPGDDRDLELLRRLQAAEVPVVSVFLSGRPMWVNPELNASDAFVAAWLPGSEGGGVADLLFTDPEGLVRHDFRGRLSFSWPQSDDQAVLNVGDPDYQPLFPYGFGLTYSDQTRLGPVSEETSGVEALSRTVYFQNGPVAPWRLFLGDARDPAVLISASRVTTRGSEALVVRSVDRHVQEDARAVAWSGETAAFVYLYGGQPVDLTRETNGDMVLAFDVLVETPPTSSVSLSMRCGDDCSAAIAIEGTLTSLPVGEWQKLLVPLRCFADAGVDMSRIDVPFALATEGRLAIRFTDVRLATVAEEGLVCP